MPCCMLGAIFIGQCLAAFAWIRKLLGLGGTKVPARQISQARHRPWGRWLVVGLSIELIVFAMIALLADQHWYQHYEHLSGHMVSIDEYEAVSCRSEQSLVDPLMAIEAFTSKK